MGCVSKKKLTLTYSLADQDFNQTKSLGILNVSTELLKKITTYSEIEKLCVIANSTFLPDHLPPNKWITINRDAPRLGKLRRMFWDQIGVYLDAKRFKTDWLFLPKGFASFLIRPPCRLAVYSHDAILDYYARHFPGVVPRMEHIYFQKSLAATLRRASVIFTNSEFTRSELLTVAKEKALKPPLIEVAGIGFTAPSPLTSERKNQIVVLVGKWPHKRSGLAVEYLQNWQHKSQFSGEIHLVGQLPDDISLPSGEGWRYHPRLPEREYRSLVNESRALVYFSEYEGFGMPPVEAVLGGVCPVYSLIPATKQVMEDTGCGFYNEDYQSFEQAINQALRTSKTQLEDWGQKLLTKHDWRKVTDRIVTRLNEIGKSN